MVQALGTRMVTGNNRHIFKHGYILITVLIFTIFFAHIFLPAQEPQLALAKSRINQNDELILSLKDSLINVSDLYIAGAITNKEYNKRYRTFTENVSNAKLKSKYLQEQYAKTRQDVDILGFPSRHKFIWNFGIGLILLFAAMDHLLLLKAVDSPIKKQKRYRTKTYLVAAGYYMAWVFFPYDDLPLPVYFLTLFALGTMSGLSAHYLFDRYYVSRGQLFRALKSFIGFNLVTSETEDFVKPEKKQWYDDQVIDLVDKAVGNEQK